MFDSFVGSTQDGPRTYNNTLGDLGGASADYQRSRHGLPSRGIDTGYSSTGAPGATGSYGGSDYANDVPDYGDGATAGDSQTGGLSGQDGAGDTVAGTGRPAGPGGAMFDAGYDPRFTSNPMFGNRDTRNPFADTWNASDVDQLFGAQDIGSEAQLGLSEQGGNIGSLLGALFGIPGLGYAGGKWGDYNIDNKTWMSPTDPNNPYASQGSGNELVNDAFAGDALPSSGMDDGITNDATQNTGGFFRPSIGGPGGYGNSIDRGYGYATRLRPRSTDPQWIPFRSIDEDKIG